MSEEHNYLRGYLTVWPHGRERTLGFNCLSQDDTERSLIGIAKLTVPEDISLQAGRFRFLTGEVYEHRVGLDIAHGYGVSNANEPEMQRIFDWIDAEVENPWSLHFASKKFSVKGILGCIGALVQPYPVFMFRDSADGVKFKLVHT